MTSMLVTPRCRTAPNACSACWAQKRKCDRWLPKCSRCAKNGVWCIYPGCDYRCPSPPSEASVSNGLASGDLMTASWDDDFDDRLTFNVCSILSRWHTGFEAVVACYLDSLHAWLPVVHPNQLNRAIAELTCAPCAELAVLILHIFLANPMRPGQTVVCGEPSEPFYNTCKSLFLQLQTVRGNRIATIQAGLLLAVYEQGEGLLSDAYITIATCAELWALSQFPRGFEGSPSVPSEILCVWWGIYALDRLHSLASGEPQRAPVIREVTIVDRLSILNNTARGEEIANRRVWAFACQIQAFLLLDQVREYDLMHRIGLQEGFLQLQFYQIDALLQQEISALLSSSASDDWVEPYLAIVILLLALIELHGNIVVTGPCDPWSDSLLCRSIMTMETVLDMIKDIVCMDDVNHVEMMPLTAVLLLRNAASMATTLETHHNRSTDVLHDLLASLKRASWRWKIAGEVSAQYCHEIGGKVL